MMDARARLLTRCSVLVLALARCGERVTPDAGDAAADTPPADGEGLDQGTTLPPPESTLRASDTTAMNAVEVQAGEGTRLAFSAAGGRALLASPANSPFLEVGAYPGGVSPVNFHDPRVPTPSGVRWRAPVNSAASTAGALSLVDDRVGPVRVALTTVGEGVFRVDVEATGRDAALLRFNSAATPGAYHGFGERFAGADSRGAVVPMQLHLGGTESSTNEHHAPVPFFVHDSGYAVFVETREAGAFDVASTDPSRVSATFEGTRARLWLFAHRDPRELTAMFARATALPRLPPAWVYGPQQWRNEWASREQLFEDARRLRAERLPTTTIWIDNPWQRSYNDGEIDPARFPDPPGMMRELAALGYRVLFWSTPYLDAVDAGASPRNTAEQRWVTARDRGYLVRQNGVPFVSPSRFFSPSGMSDAFGSMIDFTAPGAEDFWASNLEGLVRLGARAFKLDYGEEIVSELVNTRPRYTFASGETERTQHSLYPQGYHRAYRAALDRYAGGDGFVMGRASSWGGQAVLDVLWPGDLDNDFRRAEGREVGGLPAAISAMMSLAASGFPNFASDTGGYRGGRPTKEALIRWAEHTAFSMVMQLGGAGESHNPWSYDDETTALYRPLARAHNDLAPWLYSLAQRASRTGYPPVAHASLVFPGQAPTTTEDPYAYALGDELLVFPVVTAGATTRQVKLPAGGWVHWFTRASYAGGATHTVQAPLGTPAVFLRSNALLRLAPDDVDTLVERTEAGVVGLADRAGVLRVRMAPDAASAAVHSAGDTATGRVEVTSSVPGGVEVRFAPGAQYTELRAEFDLAHRPADAIATVARADAAMGPLTRAASADEVSRGCDGCWHFDATARVLRVSVRGAAVVRAGR